MQSFPSLFVGNKDLNDFSQKKNTAKLGRGNVACKTNHISILFNHAMNRIDHIRGIVLHDKGIWGIPSDDFLKPFIPA